jgi:Polyketide cyclase / dehydrase and lipid transport
VTHISGELRIARPVEAVFDFIADSRNEPRYNPDMRSVELLTGEPLGRGTRFQASMGRSGMGLLVTLTEFERPHLLGSTTTSDLMDTEGALRFRADGPSATLLSWDWQVRPKGWLRLLGPLFGLIGRRVERRIWTAARDRLEDRSAS